MRAWLSADRFLLGEASAEADGSSVVVEFLLELELKMFWEVDLK